MNLHSYDSISKSKRQAEKLADAYRAIAFKNHDQAREDVADIFERKAKAVQSCSTVWVGQECSICGKLHTMHTWGCKDRLCPICSTRRSRVLASQSQQIIPKVISDGEGDATLVTLTIKNIHGAELPSAITRMLEGWAACTQSYDMRKSVDGWARSLEITYNEQTNTFHPHIHAIVLSPEERWMDTEYWERRWKTACALDYTPVVDARQIKKGTQGHAILEVSKYITKTGALIDRLSPGMLSCVVEPLAMSIRARRLTAYGGDWAAERRKLHLKDPEAMSDIELSEADRDCSKNTIICCGTECKLIMLDWLGMQYDKFYPADMSNDEKTANAIFRGKKAVDAMQINQEE